MTNTTTLRPEYSVATPLMEREVCAECGHFHRVLLARLCTCCQRDVRVTNHHDVQPLHPNQQATRCRVCRGIARRNDATGEFEHADGS